MKRSNRPGGMPGRSFFSMIEAREFLTRLFQAGVDAADPRRATRQAVAGIEGLTPAVWVIAAGKGAHAMASGAVESLCARDVNVAGGLVVAHDPDANASHGLEAVEGDHPVPAERSQAAADRLAEVVSLAPADSDAIVLISGGATSLIAAPIDGLSATDLEAAFRALLASGADITVMNAVRKRLLRFGAGRLAIALPTRRIHCLIASDVVGNDLPSIASGPCVPDPGSAREARERSKTAGAWNSLPPAARRLIDAMADGAMLDSPPRDHPRFASTAVRIILDRSAATDGACQAAAQVGVVAELIEEPLAGEASAQGAQIAEELVMRSRTNADGCFVWSGETTVTLGFDAGHGGRCQELALACAQRLDEARAPGITVLAAGTDGRDGPTDAAGAIVDSGTWSRIRANGTDPDAALHRHTSYDALVLADALLKTGPTGTNVNDLVIALCQP
jgi:hydroxypyruvate reductase